MIKKQPARTNGVERVKSFVNVRLHCNVSNLKKISKISTLLSGKSSADARVCTDFDLILGSHKVVSFLNLYTTSGETKISTILMHDEQPKT